MSFELTVEHAFRARQGLPGRRSPDAGPGNSVEVVVRAGIRFGDDQLGDLGRFVDSDAAKAAVRDACGELGERVWTDVFDFRPTFELVARELHRRLAAQLPQLAFVEIEDRTYGTRTRYVSGSPR